MANVAILVGNTSYRNLPNLDCCSNDVLAVKDLLAATEKYEQITLIENKDADDLKSQLRSAIDKAPAPEELFFTLPAMAINRRRNSFFAPKTLIRGDQMKPVFRLRSFTPFCGSPRLLW